MASGFLAAFGRLADIGHERRIGTQSITSPASVPARIRANLEAIAGVLYLTILVAGLVSLCRN